MATHKFSGRTSQTYVIPMELADDTWRFTARSRIDVAAGTGIEVNAQDTRLIIEGAVEADPGRYAIDTNQLNTSITLTKGGSVTGTIVCFNDYASIVNHGTIEQAGGYSCLDIIGDFFDLHNYGNIRGPVFAATKATQIFNEKNGVIQGQVAMGTATESGYLENHGKIVGSFYSNNSNDIVVNDGIIRGDVTLYDGKDVLDNRGGRVTGRIFGGSGDDIYYLSDVRDRVIESYGGGEDIIKSTVSYTLDDVSYIERLQLIGTRNINATGTARAEELWGNAGNNTLNGKGGSDYFDGKAGNDLLRSADDGVENRFFFRTGYDHDTIRYFDVGLDTVYLGGWKAIDDFSDLRSHARNRGDDVVITAGHDSLTIRDMHKSELQADDFSFLL